jgi:hypothetical protein
MISTAMGTRVETRQGRENINNRSYEWAEDRDEEEQTAIRI